MTRFEWNLPATFNFGADVVDRFAEDPARVALLWSNAEGREERYTYADMARLTNRFANLLAGRGIRKGDRVVVMLPRVAQWQVALVGCLKLGAVPIPCIDMLTERDVAYRAAHSGARAVVTTAANAGKFAAIGAPLEVRVAVGGAPGWTDYAAAMEDASDTFEAARMLPDDPAIIYYTSGSTGHPKGVTHAARGLYAWRVSAEHWLGLNDGDVMWCTADTGWSKAGTSILFGPWSRGAAVVFHDGPFEPRRRFEMIERHRVNVFCGAATEFRRLVQEDISAFDLSSLRHAVSAGETVNPAVVERWQALTGIPLREAYGQTETLMTILTMADRPPRPGSMGLPSPGTEMAVLDEEGRRQPPRTAGQLAMRLPNPQVMLGYWEDRERTAQARIRGDEGEWFLTGDMALVDEDGYFHFLGRNDDVINSAGYRIGPLEVENALIEHAAVQECAVVPSPDEERGEVVKAYVVLRPGARGTPELVKELQDFVKGITAPYKYPRRIEFVEELPKTVSGKIRRRDLKEREFAGHGPNLGANLGKEA
ncbi:acyl-CoA synthetase [Azospirillum sp.]|uniref:acyl-CoA synthetase n=1 Tax=Azospirillum sp. TaxID=34012 RepID=UPI002D486739|nr:AMP-binding protein [Azospirillum sp.]HYD69158.1 AMP-binding protein [Azospirillum sp.]